MLKHSSHVNQDEFIKYVHENKINSKLYLANGVKLDGIIIGYDNSSVTLVKNNHSILVYKHAIGTISPDDCIPIVQDV